MPEIVNESAARMRFSTPEMFFKDFKSASAGALIAGVADVALVLSAEGEVLDVAFSDTSLAKTAYRDWVGRGFAEIVTIESRPKIADLLRDAAPDQITRWRQVNHPVVEGPDIPVRYATLRLAGGAVLAMERQYARIRDAEKR